MKWELHASIGPRLAVVAFALVGACMPPSWGAGALLHPSRRPVGAAPALAHQDVAFNDDGVTLRGWLFPAMEGSRGVTVVYLHGSGDNRASGVWIAKQLVRRRFDVLAYDSRAHGASGGDACTYGYYERRDLRCALDALGIRRAILVGVSLGGAVALQAAAEDPRIVGVVAVATFSDLESIARDRAPFIASGAQIREALALAEREAHFRVADASPVKAAAYIHVPVLLSTARTTMRPDPFTPSAYSQHSRGHDGSYWSGTQTTATRWERCGRTLKHGSTKWLLG